MTLFILILSPHVRAACASPTAMAGAREWVSGQFRYCEGSSWIAIPSYQALTSCANSARMKYHAATNLYRYCDGASWQQMGCVPDPGPTGCPNIGDVCSDGTVYAGVSPNASLKMYARRCDHALSWSGSACTGTRTAVRWGNAGTNTGATSTTNGLSNTNTLLGYSAANTVAAHVCGDLTADGYDDWHLPSKDELNVLRVNRTAIGNFSTSSAYPTGYYWSSTQATNDEAWHQLFTNGGQYQSWKEEAQHVRCVRTPTPSPCPSLGACTTPGQIEYFTGSGKLAFCNGTTWISFTP